MNSKWSKEFKADALRIAESRDESSVALCCTVLEVRKEHPDYGTQSMLDELLPSQKVSYGKGYRGWGVIHKLFSIF